MTAENLTPQPLTYEEFKKEHGRDAIAAELQVRYEILTGNFHDFFYDDKLYKIIRNEAVEGFNGTAVRLYEEHLKNKKDAVVGQRAGSDRHLPKSRELFIQLLFEELDEWKKQYPHKVKFTAKLISTILQSGTKDIDRAALIEKLKKAPYIIPAISLAYEIYSERQEIEETNRAKESIAKEPSPSAKRTTSAQERMAAYLKGQSAQE